MPRPSIHAQSSPFKADRGLATCGANASLALEWVDNGAQVAVIGHRQVDAHILQCVNSPGCQCNYVATLFVYLCCTLQLWVKELIATANECVGESALCARHLARLQA